MDPDYLEKWKKQMQAFYAEFKEHEAIYQHNKFISDTNLYGKEYAQLIMRNLLLMNGGALIALPAFIEIFDIQDTSLITPALYFVGGLVSIILCALSAYFCLTNSTSGIIDYRNKEYIRLMRNHMFELYTKKTIQDLESDERNLTDSSQKHFRKVNSWEIIAIILGLLSLTFFICGSLTFAMIIS